MSDTANRAGAAPALLERLDQIDADWLNSVMRAAGYGDARVARFATKAIGNGNVSDTIRVDMIYVSPTAAPSSIVCKFRSSDPAAHAHGISSGSYFREYGSYGLIGQSCRTPRLYWLDGATDNINLVMEDLTGSARAGDQIAGCGPEDARAVVVELAKLHRSFYPMSREQAPAWAMTMAGAADYWSAAINRALPVIRAEVAGRLAAEEMAIVEAAGAAAYDWYCLPMMRGTLTHGDPRVDNILFIDGQEPGAVEAVLIDWQLTGWRNPMHDLGYFLSGSMTVEDRRSHERALLEMYSDIIGPDYSFEEITIDYRVQLLAGLMTTIACYGLLPLTPAFDALLIALLKRNLAAAADWNSILAIHAVLA